MRSITASLAGTVLLVVGTTPAALTGQELPVRDVPPPDTTAECPREPAEPDPAATSGSPSEARELARAATEAALLGEPEEARDLLRRATESDPGSADLAYRRARAHDELDETESAIRWYCRYLDLTPGSGDDPEVRGRLAELRDDAGPAAGGPARDHLREGVALLEQGSLEAAERRFSEALRSDSTLAVALYNRGLARGAAGRSEPAARDLRAYLRARPDAPDRERVEEAVRFLEDPPVPYRPTRAFLLGAAVPGAGHFYTDEPVVGSVLLGVAAAATLTGILYERVEVRCLGTPRDGVCPDDQVQSVRTERPALRPGLLTAAVTAGVSAVAAHLSALSRNDEASRLRIAGPADETVAGRDGIRLLAPGLAPAPPAGGVAVGLVRLRF